MQAIRSSVCVMLLMYIGSAAAAAVAGAAQKSSIPYEFCVSEPATNGKVYISPTFQDPLRDVRGAFAGYLGNSIGFRGGARCYRLPSQGLADEFRNQRIQILHWQGANHVVATQWQPAPDLLAAVQSPDGRR